MLQSSTSIPKNTLMLYFRQILIMLINLYAMRVVLAILGAEDYGIYNVVGGVVVLFAFLSGAMTSATQRFLNFALGQNDLEQARNIYSVSLVIHVIIAVLVVVVAQTVGLWFFHALLNIPQERQTVAFVVYQLSVVSMVISTLQTPYRATIIAHEKMSFFAMLSIIDVALRLGIVFLLPVVIFDSLVTYAFLLCVSRVILFLIRKIYCNKTFEIAHFRFCKDKKLFRQLLNFSGWTVYGGLVNVSRNQGLNVLINVFHGVIVNAAMGIAGQVSSAVHMFVAYLQAAFNPQIVKSYSARDHVYFMRLIFTASKLSFYMLLFLVLPLYINADFVLRIWLGTVPEYVVVFTQVILLFLLTETIIEPLRMSIQATGDIKKYQLIQSSFIFAVLPLALLFLWIGFSPVWVLVAKTGLNVLSFVWHMFFLGERIKLPVWDFIRKVIVPIFIITGISSFITILLHGLITDGWSSLIASCVISTISIGCLVYWVGLNKKEKYLLQTWTKKIIRVGR